MQYSPILILNDEVKINSLFLDKDGNSILIGTSDGRIIKMNRLISNAYLTGERSIFAQIQDGFGNISSVAHSNLTYQLKDQIVKILENKSIISLNKISIPIAASSLENSANAVFTSQILYGGDDFVGWKLIEWQQNIPEGAQTQIFFRAGNNGDEIVEKEWHHLYSSNSGTSMSISLDNFNGEGKYIQFKIVLTTTVSNITPSVYNLNIIYKTVYASYFFTQKYILKKETNTKSIILTADVIQPQYTEIKFGVSDGSTSLWNDYTPITINQINEIPSSIKDRLKIGIKFISHTNYNYPIVNEFALMFKGDKENLLNK